MIQDILPHHFDNVYHPRQPRDEDLVLLYRQGSILIRRADMPMKTARRCNICLRSMTLPAIRC